MPASADAIIGRRVDPLGELTLSQLAVVAAVCLKNSDPAFDGVAVSMEHLCSASYGATYDARGKVRVGPHEPHWAPSWLVVVAGTNTRHVTKFALASFRRWNRSCEPEAPAAPSAPSGHVASYFLSEPVIHELLGPQMRVAFGDAAARTDAETGNMLSSFFRGLCSAITRGLSPEGRTWG
jgi:hypothetical protein